MFIAAMVHFGIGLLVIMIGCCDKLRKGYVELHGVESWGGGSANKNTTEKDKLNNDYARQPMRYVEERS